MTLAHSEFAQSICEAIDLGLQFQIGNALRLVIDGYRVTTRGDVPVKQDFGQVQPIGIIKFRKQLDISRHVLRGWQVLFWNIGPIHFASS